MERRVGHPRLPSLRATILATLSATISCHMMTHQALLNGEGSARMTYMYTSFVHALNSTLVERARSKKKICQMF